MIEVGTRVRILGTFGQKWLEAEFGNEEGELVGEVKGRYQDGVCLVNLEGKGFTYVARVPEVELEVVDVQATE